VERVRAQSYGYDETMMLLTGPEDVAMAAVDAAAATGAPVVFFCYAPHHVFSLHDIVRLEEPPHDPGTWQIVRPQDDPAWLSRSRAGSAWAPGSYHIAYATDLLEYEPEVAGLLEKVSLTAEDAQAMSYAVLVEGRSPDEVAATWIEENEDRVEDWIR
jgi:glycine betaine/proline transport system substrate-binding protein